MKCFFDGVNDVPCRGKAEPARGATDMSRSIKSIRQHTCYCKKHQDFLTDRGFWGKSLRKQVAGTTYIPMTWKISKEGRQGK